MIISKLMQRLQLRLQRIMQAAEPTAASAQRPTQTVHRFHGGLALIPNKRGLQHAIIDIPPAQVLTIALLNYQKQSVPPLVQIGQNVHQGDTLAQGLVAPVNGTVIAIEAASIAHPAGLETQCIHLQTFGDTHSAIEAQIQINNLPSAQHENTTALSTEQLHQLGIHGLGGAGFPTDRKLRSVIASHAQPSTLIINAAECEPGIACDEALMQEAAEAILHGVSTVCNLTQCKHAIIAIEDSKPLAIERMQQALSVCNDQRLSIRLIPTRYPTGAERVLVQVITGIQLQAKQRASDVGIACVNVATAHAIGQASLGYAMTSRVLSLTGDAMPNPCQVRVLLGTPIAHVLQHTNNEAALSARLRVGGPLSGFDIEHANVPVTVHTNCIMAQQALKSAPALACIRCGDCATVCPAHLQPQQLHWYAMADDDTQCQRWQLSQCIECGCCDAVCPSSIKLTETFRYAKARAHERAEQARLSQEAERRFKHREQREAQRKIARIEAIEQRKNSLKSSKTQHSAISEALARAKARKKQGQKHE